LNNSDIPSPGTVYDAYERVVAAVERHVAEAAPTVPNCHDQHVRARLVQRIVQITYVVFVRQFVEKLRRHEAIGDRWDIDGLTVESSTGAVSIGASQWINSLLYFGVLWIDMLLRLIAGCFLPAPRASSRAAILMEAGGGFEQGDDRLTAFCNQGPIEPLKRASAIIVKAQRPPAVRASSNLHYSSRPFVHLANHLLSRGDRLALLFRHCAAPWLLGRALMASRLNVLIARDLAWLPAITWLDQAGYVSDVLITTTAFTAQPLWMHGFRQRRLKLHMLWYSQNCIPKMYPGDSHRPDLPPMRHMRIDVHWVWTAGFGDYLQDLGQEGEIQIVGPILWYLPEPVELPRAQLRVAVFDITPIPDGRTAFGASKNYYTSALMKKFVGDIVTVCETIAAEQGRTLLIAIKHKRAAVLTHHDPAYLEFLDRLIEHNPAVRLVDHHTNLFGLMQDCDLSISVPYTSTAFLSASLGKPAIYYDPFAEIIGIVETDPNVYFASGFDELKRIAGECLSPSRRGETRAAG
jgi:hypothetical protein